MFNAGNFLKGLIFEKPLLNSEISTDTKTKCCINTVTHISNY